jgi:hypothetical protein
MALNTIRTDGKNFCIHLIKKFKFDNEQSKTLFSEFNAIAKIWVHGYTVIRAPLPKAEAKENILEPDPDIKFEDRNFLILKVIELKKLCKARNYKVSGNKSELIARLTGEDKNPFAQTRVVSAKEKQSRSQTVQNLISKLSVAHPSLEVYTNIYGNYEHPESCLVFKRAPHTRVVGKQTPDGVIEITREDIELCHKYGFEYDLPEDLSHELKDEETARIAKELENEGDEYDTDDEEEHDENDENDEEL